MTQENYQHVQHQANRTHWALPRSAPSPVGLGAPTYRPLGEQQLHTRPTGGTRDLMCANLVQTRLLNNKAVFQSHITASHRQTHSSFKYLAAGCYNLLNNSDTLCLMQQPGDQHDQFDNNSGHLRCGIS